MFISFHNDSGYLFEGHLTVDPEPPQPQWLVQSNLLTTAAALFGAESSQASAANETTQEDAAHMLQDLINRLEEVVPLVFIQNLSRAFDNHHLSDFQFTLLNVNMALNFLSEFLKLDKFQERGIMWLSHCLNISKPGHC